ncbi:MAG: uroporphyrinogen decarboxylase family protein [Armatimonadota bacterium]|nr:uroporphyrinogen decarboxylase family protein [Armatimonadota bacterium]
MSVLQLRSHIPIGAPARREPADGTESPLRPVLGFEPAWFRRRCDVDFGERWHRDPYYRYDTLARMKIALCQAFPTHSQWDLNRRDDLATLSGCYGICVIPAVFGLPMRFSEDRWPVVEAGHHLSTESVERLDADAVLRSAFVDELFAQMETIAREWGVIHGYLNWQGVLNNAFHLRGPEIFVDVVERPDLARHLLSVICGVMVRLVSQVQERQRRSGFYVNQLDVSNCTMNMVSPRTYREFVFEHDRRIAESFERFGVHTCNWDVTPYLEELRKLPKLGYLDMGMASDMKKVRWMFPEPRRAVLYSPVTLHDAALEEIRTDLRRIDDELAPCDVVFADIQADTPDDRVRAALAMCLEVERSGRGSGNVSLARRNPPV